MPRKRQSSPYENCITPPVYQSASYFFSDERDVIDGLHDQTIRRGRYGRYNNPSWIQVEERLRELHKADKSLIFASGMAAHFTTFLSLLKQGDRVAIPSECYRQTRNVFLKILPKFGIEVHEISIRDSTAFLDELARIAPSLSLLHLEMPSSPHMYLIDLERVRECVGRDLVITLDSSFSPPVNFQPLEWGVDIALCSGTKYLSGHGDIVVGVVSGRQDLLDRIQWYRDTTGPVIDGNVASLLNRSLETLELRIAKVNLEAQDVAEALAKEPRISRVLYTGLDSHPHRALAKKYLKGHGGVITFDLSADDVTARKFVDSLKVPYMASNFGAAQTLVEQSTFFTYFEYNPDELRQIGVNPGTIRLSLGYTSSADELINDLRNALSIMD